MKKFKNILFVDERHKADGRSLERAFELAQENDARLTISTVLDQSHLFIPHTSTWLASETLVKEVSAELLAIFKEEIKPLEQKYKVKASARVFSGRPFVEITRAVVNDGYDLVVIASQSPESLSDYVFGTTTIKLLRKCPCPVWVLRPSKRKRFHHIVVAIDPSSELDEQKKLNHQLMELGLFLATKEQSQLDIVHCWQEPVETLLKLSHQVTVDKVKKLNQETKVFHQDCLDRFVKEYTLPELHSTKLLKGDSGSAILKYLNKNRSDLLIMGTLSRHSIEGFFMGNTAERVVNDLPCALLAVKPEGFVSPIAVD